MFAGTGLIFTYGNNNNKNTNHEINNNSISTNETNKPSTNLGIDGTLGSEWRVNKKIGIHCEYLITGFYYWNKMENKSSTNGINNPASTSTSSRILLGTKVLFGLSIYF